MNTRKQVLIMSALLLLMLVTIGIYGAWYPSREDDAAAYFEEQTAERGAILFARNCRLCHGDIGEGGLIGGRLPAAPALDRPSLQGFADSKATLGARVDAIEATIRLSAPSAIAGGDLILIDDERMKVISVEGNAVRVERGAEHTTAAPHSTDAVIWLFDEAVLTGDHMRLVTNTITCGRVGTAMPAWSQEHGGPLSDEQIRQLMTVITGDHWNLVKAEVDIEDRLTELTAPLDGDDTVAEVKNARILTAGNAIRLSDERLRIVSVVPLGETRSDTHGIIVVERGIKGTTPLEHAAGDIVYMFPEVAEPAILQSSCGQTAKAPAPVGTPSLIEPFTGQTVDVIAQGVAFDKRTITVNAGGRVRMRLDNRDADVPHNIGFYQSATNLTPVSTDSVGITFSGLAIDDTAFDVPARGSYFFRCDVHPTIMTGTFSVQ